MTTVSEEKTLNPRLSKSKVEFVEVMKKLGLAYPKKIGKNVSIVMGTDKKAKGLMKK